MNIWTNVLLSRVDATQSSKLQLLQNLLRAVNSGPAQNNLVPSSGFLNEASAQGAEDLFLPNFLKNNYGLSEAVTFSPQNDETNSLSNTSMSNSQSYSCHPAFVEATTTHETSSVDQFNPCQVPLDTSPLIDTFDSWDEVMNDESFWKGILA
ncbi:hypothetical protein ACH5RR_039038 [Cinchona calisaya]|uniref:Uncharacterized protein n=1 Tax=Cinchona calisaya TaxID=153742 RepID=A0ABD2Y2D3_9GENT